MGDYIILAILVIAIVAIIIYLYRAKKNGQACIGCPHSKQCTSKNNSSCGGNCSCCSGCSSKQDK